MNMHEQYKRRIRIVGKPDEMRGFMLTVLDAQTGEAITNVTSAVVYLSVDHDNWAELTYYEANAEGGLVRDHQGQPIEKSVRVDNPEIELTAYEIPKQMSREEG